MNIEPQIKSISFEAKPMWETSKNMKPFTCEGSSDKIRNDKYEDAKEILNRYVRTIILKATDELADTDMKPTYQAIADSYANDDKKYRKLTGDLKNLISKTVEKHSQEYQIAKNQGSLFNEKKSELLKNMELTDEERELVLLYNNFTSYFSKYFTAVKTITCGTGKNSIADRIVENICIYVKNTIRISRLSEYPELNDAVTVKAIGMDMSMCMCQKGIDEYNRIIGNTEGTGINTIISEYRQKNRCRVQLLSKLNKIPFCEKGKQQQVISINDKHELCEAISKSIQPCENIIRFCKGIGERLDNEDRGQLHITKTGLSALSVEIFGGNSWGKLQNIVSGYDEGYVKGEPVLYGTVENALRAYEGDSSINISRHVSNIAKDVTDSARDIGLIKTTNGDSKDKLIIRDFYSGILKAKNIFSMFDTDYDCAITEEFEDLKEDFRIINSTYNMIRNFYTRKPYEEKKWNLYFDKSTFLSSFDADKFESGITLASILRKDGMYYLMILNPEYSNRMPQDAYDWNGEYEFLTYKQLTGVNKMFPKVFLSKKNRDLYKPSEEIIRISEGKLYTKDANDRESLCKWIRFCIDSFKKNGDWVLNFNPKFRQPEEYESANQFYTETEKYLLHMDFEKRISEEYLKSAVKDGKIMLFRFHSKDFSPYHTGVDGKYTNMLRETFSEWNIRTVNETIFPAIKLASGGSELVYKPASIPYAETHKAKCPIENKNPLNPQKYSTFEYSICKNKRKMRDRYILKIALQIGFRNDEVNKYELDREVNEFVKRSRPNILSVRMGEQQMLYYMVNNWMGGILEQGCLDILESRHNDIRIRTDYKRIIENQENEVKEKQKNWDYVKNIRFVKEGYISAAISRIVEIQKEYEAVIITEDFNSSFLKARSHLRTIYQEFQKQLLTRYSCVLTRSGRYSDAIQMAYPVSTFEQMKVQSGIVYFVSPTYISKTDFFTSFINDFSDCFYYESIKKAKPIVQKMRIEYNQNEDDFTITYEGKEPLHTKGDRAVFRNGKFEIYDCTSEMKELLANYHISEWETDILDANIDRAFYEKLFDIIRIMLKMHYYDIESGDYHMLSPIKGGIDTKNSRYFPNSSSVKTYMLFLKGMMAFQNINAETMQIEYSKDKDHMGQLKELMQTLVPKCIKE